MTQYHFNSSIRKKKCKCKPDCDKYPTLGYGGYYSLHVPEELKEANPTKYKKKAVQIRKQSIKTQLSKKLHEVNDNGKSAQWDWFQKMRPKMTGVCQCGCGNKSQKDSGEYFHFCICHLFPKKIFKSISMHPLNWVERRFFGGCHTNLDSQGMDKWINMADWDDIKEKFHLLAPLLTDEERATKFYRNFENLVYYGNIEGKSSSVQ